MANRRLPGTRRGAHSLGTGSQDRLRVLGDQLNRPIAGPAWNEPKVRWRVGLGGFGGGLGRLLAVAVAIAVVVYVVVQLLRPLPSVGFHGRTTSLRLSGTAPVLPWPSSGEAAMSEVGVGSLGQAGSTTGVPTASMIKVLTAYVVLKDHPMADGSQGPSITVPADIVTDYQQGVASQQSEVQVSAGETLTEMQALQGMLIASGNDLALLLAQWDASSESAFLTKENDEARALGLTATHVTDPSGLDPATVSSAEDLVRLGEVAMSNSTFAQIVAMPAITLPEAGLIYNFDYDLGHDGIIGIKTGSDSAAGGCFLFAAQQTVSGQTVTVVGAVLGQEPTTSTSSMLQLALDDAEAMVTAVWSNLRSLPLVPPGERVGTIDSPWGSSVGVVAPQSPTVVAVPGTRLAATVQGTSDLGSSVAAGARVGELIIRTQSGEVKVPLRSAGALGGPGIGWRLTQI